MKKNKNDIRITVTLSNGDKITATMGTLNYLAILGSEACDWNHDIGCHGCASEAKCFSDEIFAALDARGLYDEVRR